MSMDMSDVQIADSISREMEESFERIAQSAMELELYKVTYYLAEGYDGVDIFVNPAKGWQVSPWNGSPPTYGLLDGPTKRYDFRDVRFSDLKREHDRRRNSRASGGGTVLDRQQARASEDTASNGADRA